MPTRRVELNDDHLREAREAAAARTYTSRDPLVFANVNEVGLQLRVQGGSASWILKFDGHSKSLGKLTEQPSIKKAVELARHVRALLKLGEDPSEYLKLRSAKKSHNDAVAKSESLKARADGAWTWKQLADAYETQYLSQPKVTREKTKPPSEASVLDFRRYTSTPHHQTLLDDVLVRDMTPELVEKIRNLTKQTNGPNAGRKVVQWISAALTWGQTHHKLHTGLGLGFAWWKGVSPGYVPPSRSRFLELDEIAKLLYIAEKHRDLPGRVQFKETNEAVLAALWWIVLTAQRSSASMKLTTANIINDKSAPGWKIAAFPAEDMKSKRYHALPLPPRVVLLLERARMMSADRNSCWAFPSLKERRAGSALTEDLHIHDTTVYQLIRRLRGKDEVGKKRESPDLLEGIPQFSPHDLRRSLATHLSDVKVRGDAASAVLDHSTPTPGAVEFREADITRMVYNQSQRIELKREAMEIWTSAVFEAVEKEWKLNRPHMPAKLGLPRRIDPNAKPEPLTLIKFSPFVPWYVPMEREKERRRPNFSELPPYRPEEEPEPKEVFD